MKSVRVTMGIEHRFVYEAADVPVPLNDLAKALSRPVTDAHEIPDTDLLSAVWKVPNGAEMSLPDKCAAKLIALGYAELVTDASADAAPVAPAAAA